VSLVEGEFVPEDKAMASISRVVALVTGGASGLGRATVERLVKSGARVGVGDLPTAEATARQWIDVLGKDRVIFCPVDVSLAPAPRIQAMRLCAR
jgi:3-hydroxyacyl-CoA dehydrogenase/3-hydroxy-2-methylbutyryl-CoA dehydrogenase